MEFFVWSRSVSFDETTHNLIIDGKEIVPDIRTYGQMKQLYWFQDSHIGDEFWLYYMFRGVTFSSQDATLFEREKLRYDITILIPKSFWGETNKTFGHFHPQKPDWKYFEEIYEVLSGQAIYFQQSDLESYYTYASQWDKVLMQSWYGHLTINPSETEYLVMANIVSPEFSSLYGPYREKNGGAYYLKNGVWEKNPNYQSDISLSEKTQVGKWENIYDDFLVSPEMYSYLK